MFSSNAYLMQHQAPKASREFGEYNPPPTDLNEKVIWGPYHLYEGSFVIEFLEPHPSRNATVLMRATYKGAHPLCRRGKKHPQAPPLHIHFDQSETFTVLAGQIGTTTGWSATDKIFTPSDGQYEIVPWEPHDFWPDPTYHSDATLLVWAHPQAVPEPMDHIFFRNLIIYISDVHEGKEQIDLLQIMLMQHVTATAMVMFPRAWWLGPVRWWVPWKLQAAAAWVARWRGYSPLMERYEKME